MQRTDVSIFMFVKRNENIKYEKWQIICFAQWINKNERKRDREREKIDIERQIDQACLEYDTNLILSIAISYPNNIRQISVYYEQNTHTHISHTKRTEYETDFLSQWNVVRSIESENSPFELNCVYVYVVFEMSLFLWISFQIFRSL